jgi:TonB family protein
MAAADVMALRATGKVRKVQRWLLLLLICLGVHIGLIWFLQEPTRRSRGDAGPAFEMQLIADPWLSEQLTAAPDIFDPASFALPSLEGFSGSAWLSFRPLQPGFSTSLSEPSWLELKEDDLANVFDRLFPTNRITTLQIADVPLPPLIGTVPQVTRELSAPASSVRAEGPLAGRLLADAATLPPQANTDVLTNTTVQVLVDAEGKTLSSTILSSCGSKEADAFALKWAQKCRFKPLRMRGDSKASADQLACGKLIFEWQTVPPPTTPAPNSAAARTP